MRIIENELINCNELLKYGFIKENEVYLYETKKYDEQFEMIVTLENNKMISKLFVG